MKVHFFGSLTGNRMKIGDKTHYERIVNTIEKLGHKVLTRHYLTKKIKTVLSEPMERHGEYIKEMTNWIKKADIIIVEITKPEIGTGYELALAVNYGKPIITLYTGGEYSPVLAAQDSEKMQHIEYDVLRGLRQTLRIALDVAKEQIDTRFTLLLPPKIVTYLNDLSKNRKIPRSVFIRNLIKEKMKDKN